MAARRKKTRSALAALALEIADRTSPVDLSGLRGTARSVATAELIRAHPGRPVLVLGASAKRCDALADDLRTVLGEESDSRRLCRFPRHDTLPYDRFSPQAFLTAQRMDVLYRWLSFGEETTADPAPVVVSDWTALALRVPSRASLDAAKHEIAVGSQIDRDEWVKTLTNSGYAQMPLVAEPGEIAVRGGIVDFFPPHRAHPLRAEFFGDEVDSLREFDPKSQRSLSKLSHAVASPPRELLFTRNRIVEQADAIREAAAAAGVSASESNELLDALLRGHTPPGAEALAPILQLGQESVLDFLPPGALVIVDDPGAGRKRLEEYHREAQANHRAALESNRAVCPPEDLLVSPDELSKGLQSLQRIGLERIEVVDAESSTRQVSIETRGHDELREQLAAVRTQDRALMPLADQLTDWQLEKWRCVVVVSVLSAAERTKDLLSQYGLESNIVTAPRPCWHWSQPGRLEIRVASLSVGFSIPSQKIAAVTEEEIFGKRERRRTASGWKEGAALDGIAQLQLGDPVVHRDHGIGLYRGLNVVRAGRVENELLCIEYSAGDKLFLPIDRLNLVQRYGAFEGSAPKVDRLGGDSWRRARGRVKKSLRNMAQELLSMHAARELAPGFGFSGRDGFFEEFEAAFEFEETPDQAAAIEDVLNDMQKPRPMDRIVCGDVGYGKTEVAIRAAFKAAMDGKQVAILTPTTILCEQHFETFEARFAGYPIRVEMLSRFRTAREARQVLEGLADGTVDIVIGTHRLLHKSIQFRELGLLVVDEEQRFGVGHKERIKRMRRTVDVLTLTATPIPRTLQMAFTGLRDLSVIDTPPIDRLAIRTQVCLPSESLIREAILREVRRGGQIFYLHNRVASIGSVAEMLAEVVPEVSVITAHGQMKERELEGRMHAFVRGEADVLLCTTIIESGLDIPRANTIIINRADALGLAQLYQLRGRVGRSTRRAYAYLLIPTTIGRLPKDAQKRLEAIQDLTELGSGFRLANMDLEIRGAGDLLGSEQSGNLRAVGYETYMEMLDEIIEELRGTIHEETIDPEVQLPIVARMPEDYISDVNQRLVVYKRLSSARDGSEVARVREELLDRYGVMPAEGENLLQVIRLKIRARKLGIASFRIHRGEFVLQVAESSQIDPQRLVQILTRAGSGMRVTPDHRIYSPAPGPEGGNPALFDAAHELIRRLSPD
ncbi:MAG: transcription-repair coupling factor [Myxococcota bacterium]|nr:transcription-repair coupling factor [Myxococcota bacterium]